MKQLLMLPIQRARTDELASSLRNPGLARTFSAALASVAVLILAMISPALAATTLAGMDIDRVASDAELIFEGEVLLQEVRRDDASNLIYSYVTFSIRDVIKGDYDGETLELRFTGGNLNGDITEVSGLVIPPVGEQGIYFVESTAVNLLNPLLGWSQGHFVILEEEGERLVHTIDQRPVIKVEAVSSIPPSIKLPQQFIEGKTDVAAGVSTRTSSLTIEKALTVDQFKSRINELLEN